MFTFNVKGSALKNLLALHAKQIQEMTTLREQFEQERDALERKDAEAMQQVPAHIRPSIAASQYGYASISPLPQMPKVAQKAIEDAAVKHGLALNRWFSEQLQDDVTYTLSSDDLRIFGFGVGQVRQCGGLHPMPIL